METKQNARMNALVDDHVAYLAKLGKSTVAQTLEGTSGNDVFYVTHTGDKIIETANGGTDSVYSNVSHTLATHVENLTLLGSDNIFGAGNNSDNILIGNSGHNRLNSGRGHDVVHGHDGNDTINGGEGNDILYGDAGNDIINGGAGEDVLYGGAGDDTFVIDAQGGHDVIIDGEGSNAIKFVGISFWSHIAGGGITEIENESGGRDWKISSKIIDDWSVTIKNQYPADSTTPTVNAFIFDNQTFSVEYLKNWRHVRTVPALSDKTIYGTAGNDELVGTPNSDVINGLAGADIMRGLGGDDTYHVDHVKDTVIEGANGGKDTVMSSVSHTAATHVENVTLTGSNHIFAAGNNSDNVLTGNSGNNRLNSGRGKDTVYGMAGNDNLNGGDGDDYLDGGDGDDVINGDAGNDKLYGRAGNDRLNGGAGDDYLEDASGHNVLRGGAGNDVYAFKGGNNTIIDDEGINELDFIYQTRSFEDIRQFEVSENADGSQNWIITIQDNWQATIQNQVSADGRISIDRFKVGGQVYTAQAFLDALKAEQDSRVLKGTSGDDTLTINQDGRYTVYGYEGNDVIYDNDVGDYGLTSDIDDRLYGGAGDDKIYAGHDTDYLDGGSGNDYLEGGDHSDTYVFGRGYGKDTIFDFNFERDDEYGSFWHNKNTVKFTDGITAEDLEITISAGYDPSNIRYDPSETWHYNVNPITGLNTWKIKIKGTDDELTILNQDPTYGAVSYFEFASGEKLTSEALFKRLNLSGEAVTKLNLQNSSMVDDQTWTIYGTSGNDHVSLDYSERFQVQAKNVVYGGDGNDTVKVGREGPDHIDFYGGAGDDTLSAYVGSGIFDGGLGNDTLHDNYYGMPNMTMIFRAGDGHDHVYAEGRSDSMIHFTGGLDLGDVSISYGSDKAVLTLKNSGDTITLHQTLPSPGEFYAPIDKITFDSGKVYRLKDISSDAQAGEVSLDNILGPVSHAGHIGLDDARTYTVQADALAADEQAGHQTI